MRLGLGLSLTSLRGGVSTFSIASLFSDASGAWYEMSPDACFQNSDGTGACVSGDPVGYITDLSGSGNHATQATAAARMTLAGAGPYYLDPDGVDDNFSIPIGNNFVGGFALILDTGPIFGSIDTASDGGWAYTKDPNYIPEGRIHALIVLDRALTTDEKNNIAALYSTAVTTRPATARTAFRDRTDLTALDASYGDWTQVTDAAFAFYNCSSLTAPPDVSGWTQVTNASLTFRKCSGLTTPPDVSGWTQVTNASAAFGDCPSLTAPPDVSGWTQVTDAAFAFYNCSSLTAPPDVSGWTQVTNASLTFRNCSGLTTPPDVSGWTQVTNATSAFGDCSSLTAPPDVSDWTQVTSAREAFYNCSSLTAPPDVSGWTQVTNASLTFRNCSGLTTPPDVSGWTQVTNASDAFRDCSNLTSAIDISGWDPTTLTEASDMMDGISAAGFDQTAYDDALIAWDAAYDLTTVNTLSIDFGSAQYTAGGAAETARNTLAANGWTITDGGAA